MKNIFIHGWGFSKEIWKDFYSLENSIFLDIPFHGGFRSKEKGKILNSFSTKLYKEIEKIKSPTTLIGWSLGATISVLITLKKPKNLKRLILIGFSPKFKDEKLGHSPMAVKAFMISLRKNFDKTVFNFRKTATGHTFPDIPFPQKEGSISLLNEFVELDLTEKIPLIDIETIFIHGKNDKIINYNASIFSSKKVKKSKIILTDDNHAPFLTKRELITTHLL